ncbi:hypothetical protein PR202_gb19219 [Eleusine coracana subsp. coracana]|uniref:DC1 domain-containing protein n=1 Tax=Eleusine coracana subsp. coracana TaxID=191504 RepID=A0AAV5F7E0_ELECO|nr:hypothetical protein QOZ80_3BG0287230 [Eleusine coracana subsp. coracana]GJN30876.1 hypothetical protein PR202_gb19219 [Eleusine coracana subsp. coracana]
MKMYDDLPAVISHEAHRAHKLKLVTTDGPPFRCDGCMEPGSGQGRRYRCDSCDFDLHTSCAVPEYTLKHPLYGDDLEFQLLHSPLSVDGKFCNACGYATLGFVYQCSRKDNKDLELHPCCAALKMETVLPDGHILQLCKEAKQDCLFCREKGRPLSSSSSSPASKKFWTSFRKEKLWAYQWRCGGSEGYLHVVCMKKIAAQIWEQTYQDSPGGGVVEASVPVMKGMLQGRSSLNSETSAAIAVQGTMDLGATIADVISASMQ